MLRTLQIQSYFLKEGKSLLSRAEVTIPSTRENYQITGQVHRSCEEKPFTHLYKEETSKSKCPYTIMLI